MRDDADARRRLDHRVVRGLGRSRGRRGRTRQRATSHPAFARRASRPRVGLGSHSAHHLVFRELVRRRGRGREDAAHHDGSIGIAAEEVDEHLLTDARDVERAEARARPGLVHRDPTGARLVVLAVAIPVEFDADAPELVGVDLLAGRSGDGRALDAERARLRRHQLRAEVDVGVARLAAMVPLRVDVAFEHRRDDEQRRRELGARMARHREDRAGPEVERGGAEGDDARLDPDGIEPLRDLRRAVALVGARRAAVVGVRCRAVAVALPEEAAVVVVVALERLLGVAAPVLRRGERVVERLAIVDVALGVAARAHLARADDLGDEVAGHVLLRARNERKRRR